VNSLACRRRFIVTLKTDTDPWHFEQILVVGAVGLVTFYTTAVFEDRVMQTVFR
jgi:hypothetical protein